MFSSCRCSTTLPSSPLLPNLHFINRRSLLLLSTTTTTTTLSLSSPLSAVPPPPPDTTITDRIFMDFSVCPTYFQNRTLGDELSQCVDSEPLGRLVLGLYGNLVPLTVSNFKSMCTGSSGSSYRGTLVHKLFPGQFFVAGRQGRRDKGEVKPPTDLVRNTESVDPRAFLLGHSRAGVVSLCLSENDDDDEIKLDPNYRNVEFLITTGPGQCPQLDNKNIVFGTVLEGASRGNSLIMDKCRFTNSDHEFFYSLIVPLCLNDLVIHYICGLDVVTTIASIPTYRPGERIRQYNDLAQFLGDERAKTARAIWNKPLKTVYISDCGELKVAKPTLSPSLP